MYGAVEDVPWRDQYIAFIKQDMFPMGPRKYTRSTTVSSSDLKTYDAGQLFVCAVSCADTSSVGKLWVEYDVELFIPQNPVSASAGSIGSSALYSLITTNQTLTDNTATVVLFNSEVYDSIGASVSSGFVTLPTGNFLVSTVLNVLDSSATSTTNITIEIMKNGASLSPAMGSSFPSLVTSNADYSTSCLAIVSSSGSDTVSVKITSTSFSDLQLIKDRCQLAILRVL